MLDSVGPADDLVGADPFLGRTYVLRGRLITPRFGVEQRFLLLPLEFQRLLGPLLILLDRELSFALKVISFSKYHIVYNYELLVLILLVKEVVDFI